MRDLEVDGAVAELEAAEAEVGAVQPRVLPFAPLVPRQVQERRGLGERQEAAGAEQPRRPRAPSPAGSQKHIAP